MKLAVLLWAMSCIAVSAHAGDADWPSYGGDDAKTRHSALTQINRAKRRRTRARVAVRHPREGRHADPAHRRRTHTLRLHAFSQDFRCSTRRPANNSGSSTPVSRAAGANRGLMYWADGKDARMFAAVDNFVYALNAATGKPIAAFGNSGRIDLRENLGRDPSTQSVRLTSPGVIYQGPHDPRRTRRARTCPPRPDTCARMT